MVHEGTLIRIYAKYGNDFKSIQKSRVEGGLLRNIIPVGNQSGIVQYYSDYNQAKELENYRLTGEKVLKDVIARELQIRSIPDPEWMKIYYWNHGVHHWKPNVNIKSAVPEIQWNPFGAKHNIRIVGEAFCRNQGWIEGALENADEFYKEWLKRRKSKIRNGTIRRRGEYIIRRRGECTMRDVEKHNKPGDAWTVIHGKVYDITKLYYTIQIPKNVTAYSYYRVIITQTQSSEILKIKQLSFYGYEIKKEWKHSGYNIYSHSNIRIGTVDNLSPYKLNVDGTINAISYYGSAANLTGLTAAQIPSLDASKITIN
jgi:hypothetical protein